MAKGIVCQICGDETHVIASHLKEKHTTFSLDEYRAMYPDAPLISEGAKLAMTMKQAEVNPTVEPDVIEDRGDREIRAFNRVFGIPDNIKSARSTRTGKAIPITVMKDGTKPDFAAYVPKVDQNYIFPIEATKLVLLGIETRVPHYLVGHAGTGKSTLIEQVHARTKRPMMRIQHTVNMEESHLLGLYVIRDGETVWEPGPLQIAMKNGITLLADEYDRAPPQVLSVYQPVLEGKALITKEAPPEWRVIEPHPDFRIAATGNTNGAGDDSGLYPSTALQDFANYERFGIMVEVDFMPPKQEAAVVRKQAGVPQEFADKLVDFATRLRKEFKDGNISAPVSPRSLINAAKVGAALYDFYRGVQHAITMRMNPVDRRAAEEIAQRVFGERKNKAEEEYAV